MFNMEMLKYFSGNRIMIFGKMYKLDTSGDGAVWINDSHRINATPKSDGSILVQIFSVTGDCVGCESYYFPEINNYDMYCHIVRSLSEKILKRT